MFVGCRTKSRSVCSRGLSSEILRWYVSCRPCLLVFYCYLGCFVHWVPRCPYSEQFFISTWNLLLHYHVLSRYREFLGCGFWWESTFFVVFLKGLFLFRFWRIIFCIFCVFIQSLVKGLVFGIVLRFFLCPNVVLGDLCEWMLICVFVL